MPHSSFTTVPEYIASFPPETQQILQELRQVLHEQLPKAEEGISYQIACLKLNGKAVIYFAGFTNHVSIYPFSNEMATSMEEAALYKTSGKGTIQFPLTKPLPIPFIKKIAMRLLAQHQKNCISSDTY